MTRNTATPNGARTGYGDGYGAACDDWYNGRPNPRSAPTGRSTAYTRGWEQGYADGRQQRREAAHRHYLDHLDEG